MPRTNGRILTVGDALTSAANLRIWAAQRLDLAITQQQMDKVFREHRNFFRSLRSYWMGCVRSGDCSNAASVTDQLRFDLLEYSDPKICPIERPTARPDRVFYPLDDYDRVIMKLHMAALLTGDDEFGPWAELAYKRREDFIGELDCNEFIYLGDD